MVNILEDVFVPEDGIFDKLLICNGSHYPTVILNGKLQNILLNLEVDIIKEKTFRAEILVHQNLSHADKLAVCHEWDL